MTTPGGVLAWGQAGTYDAIEDRSVIRTLTGGQFGIVTATTLAAGTGLVVNMGPWNAVVDTGDGASAVVGSRDVQTISLDAGGGAARTDVMWADIDPDAGAWALAIITPAQIPGRAGVEIGRAIVPPGANSAAAMDLIPAPASFGRDTMRRILYNGPNVQIPSTTPILLGGLELPCLPGSYLVRVGINGNIGGTTTVARFAIYSPAVAPSGVNLTWRFHLYNAAGAAQYIAIQNAQNGLTNPASGNQPASAVFRCTCEGTINVTAPGTLSIWGARSQAANPWNLRAHSFLEVARFEEITT